MRIAIMTAYLLKGGSERVILEIARSFDATIFCPKFDPEMTYPDFVGLDVVETGRGVLSRIPVAGGVLSGPSSMLHFSDMRVEGYDVINPHLPQAELVRGRGCPVLWYCYSPNRFVHEYSRQKRLALNPLARIALDANVSVYKMLEREAVKKISHVFAVSGKARERVKDFLGRDSEVLYPGIHAGKYRCRPAERFFFYPSRIDPMKNFEYAIEAFRLFSSRVKGWKLVIAGSVGSGNRDYLRKLRSIAGDSVVFETDITDERMLELYSMCAAVVYSPINEDLGLIPLEGMASSKPCIACDDGGTRETVADGKDGFLTGGPAQMAEKMEWLANNPDECERMGRVGREKVLRDFTWGRFTKRFREKAEELAGDSTAGP